MSLNLSPLNQKLVASAINERDFADLSGKFAQNPLKMQKISKNQNDSFTPDISKTAIAKKKKINLTPAQKNRLFTLGLASVGAIILFLKSPTAIKLKAKLVLKSMQKSLDTAQNTIQEVSARIPKNSPSGNIKFINENGIATRALSDNRFFEEFSTDGKRLLRRTEFDPATFKPKRIFEFKKEKTDVIDICGNKLRILKGIRPDNFSCGVDEISCFEEKNPVVHLKKATITKKQTCAVDMHLFEDENLKSFCNNFRHTKYKGRDWNFWSRRFDFDVATGNARFYPSKDIPIWMRDYVGDINYKNSDSDFYSDIISDFFYSIFDLFC